MSLIEGFIWGVVGGVLAELIGLFRLRTLSPQDFPDWLKTPFYRVITVVMILAGGILVVAYLRSDVKINAIIAINLGASAPLLLGSLVSQTPQISPGRID
jgi:hypothetical protein